MTKLYPDSLVLLLAIIVCCGWLLAAWIWPRPALTQGVPAPSPIRFSVHEGTAPIAVYRERDQTLVIGAHAPRGLLVCFRDERPEHCKLVEEWLELK
jgi:hypothetical protein